MSEVMKSGTGGAAERAKAGSGPTGEPDEGSNLNIAWGPIRSHMHTLSFSDIKRHACLAGLDVTRLAHLEQGVGGKIGATKAQLLTAIDGIIGDMPDENKNGFLTIIIENLSKEAGNSLPEELEANLQRLGWQIVDGKLIPRRIFDVSELKKLPTDAHEDLLKAATKLRDGDLSGAISSACAAVDSVTSSIYREEGLGDPQRSGSFQQRVTESYKARKVSDALKAELTGLSWGEDDIRGFTHNLKGAVNQAANVMEKLRPKMGDAHGSRPVSEGLVYDSIKWACIIVRLLA
jgi:hypothetical protein